MLHENRKRAGSFGDDAEAYDRARPSYPDAMVDDLLRDGPCSVLDVGCGTGKAARAFIARGCDVLGIEPDARMAAVARRHGLIVEDGMFETWDARGRTFDLLVSGQAWHWVDPVAGAARAEEAVRPGGRVALFWNMSELHRRSPIADELRALYQRIAPDIEDSSILLWSRSKERFDDTGVSFESSGGFVDVAVTTYPWSHTYRTGEWLDHLMTHSDHRGLAPEVREPLLAAIGGLIAERGGSIDVHYRCWLVTARRTA